MLCLQRIGTELNCFSPRSERSVKLAFGIMVFVKNSKGFREFEKNSYLKKKNTGLFLVFGKVERSKGHTPQEFRRQLLSALVLPSLPVFIPLSLFF